MKKELAVVLLSGGMDSCVTVAIARESHEIALLHVNYGQKTEKKELHAFSEIAQHYHVTAERRLVIDMKYLGGMGGSSLTDPKMDIPTTANLLSGGIPSTYVPFRNTHLLAVAVSWAEVLGARKVFIGAVESDSPYPDCREAYYKAFNQLVAVGTRPDSQIVVETPLLHLKKADIVKRGMTIGVPFHLSWSCYRVEEKACGECRSCKLRLGAFKEAGYRDPIPYCEANSLTAVSSG